MAERSIRQVPVHRAGESWLFAATILTGSFLLFLVQPMVARMALPRLGGAPAVWNSAMLVYQALLLGGYAYAHALRRLRPRAQAGIHVAVLAIAALWLPIGIVATRLPADAVPALWVPWLLGLSIGPLFFAVSAQAPLMQRWYSLASGGRDPYALYAASNLGSFGGLIAYPLLVEPLLKLRSQSGLWSAGYGLLVLLVVTCALLLPRGSTGTAAAAVESAAPGLRRQLKWVTLALVPSGLMLATTTFLTTDIVAVPLLWVIPLGLYLLSFTVAFAARRAAADLLTRIAPLSILLLGGIVISGNQDRPFLAASIALLLLFVVSVALHSAMYRSRPDPDRLTGFYLAMSVGGALGGVFAGLVAPVLFDWNYEYPILILAAAVLVPQSFLIPAVARGWRGGARRRWLLTAGIVLAAVIVTLLGMFDPGGHLGPKHEGVAFLILAAFGVLATGRRAAFVTVVAAGLFLLGGYRALQLSWQGGARTRSYFGVYTVIESPRIRRLAHGTTLHGVQLAGSPERERWPTTYYGPHSGVGRAMLAVDGLYGVHARVGVVGLGTGTLACYARPGQDWRFYEIDPAVVRIARDTGQFSFLRRCLPHPRIVIGDARLSLSAEPKGQLDLLALDAFSSDAVPMHLMTTEAFANYRRVLAPDGLLLVHISNRFLDLLPVVSAAARTGGWHAVVMESVPEPAEVRDLEQTASLWIALSQDSGIIQGLRRGYPAWSDLAPASGFTPWSDDYASILPLVKAFHDRPPGPDFAVTARRR